MVAKQIWLSYDLGVQGDYQGLYAWLDKNGAKECGSNIATLKYEASSDKALVDKIAENLKKFVEFRPRDRVYLIWREDGSVRGRFIIGNRKAAPWVGFSQTPSDDDM